MTDAIVDSTLAYADLCRFASQRATPLGMRNREVPNFRGPPNPKLLWTATWSAAMTRGELHRRLGSD